MENSIVPIQQFRNTVGKNATDSTLIIDAMDILYTGNVDGFCIVSSDGDFTRLASRLKESGMDVIGMGENKTPRSFRAACSVFTDLELLLEAAEEEEVPLGVVGEGGAVPLVHRPGPPDDGRGRRLAEDLRQPQRGQPVGAEQVGQQVSRPH